jgi:hypothetical protein
MKVNPPVDVFPTTVPIRFQLLGGEMAEASLFSGVAVSTVFPC